MWKANAPRKIRGIVLCTAAGTSAILLPRELVEKGMFLFSLGDKNMTEADFDYWKALSDELYKEEDRKSNEITRMNVSIGDIEETQLVSVESAETEFVRSISEEDIFKMEIMSAQLILRIAREKLSDIQLRGFLSYYILSDKMRKLSPGMLRIVENIIDECVKI